MMVSPTVFAASTRSRMPCGTGVAVTSPARPCPVRDHRDHMPRRVQRKPLPVLFPRLGVGQVGPVLADPLLDVLDAPHLAHGEGVVRRRPILPLEELLHALAADA